MKKTVLFIDGENFKHKIEEIIKKENLNSIKFDINNIKIDEMIEKVFKDFTDINIVSKKYYAAKLYQYKETLEKSKKLISNQRRLRNNLIKREFEFIIAGNVRARFIKNGNNLKAIFNEKGVDVRIAVDMISLACDKKVDTIILCSSDSDLQPAVKEARLRNVEVIYLGFSINPNKGLTFTTNQTILFRNHEVISALIE